MKTTTLLILCLAYALSAHASEVIDQLLDERIEANKKFTVELVEEAKEMEESEKVVALEKQNGEDWVKLLKHIKDKKDPKLSYLMLRTELQGELLGAHYDFEYPEGVMDKMKAKGKINRIQKQLEELEAAYKKALEAGGKEDEEKAPK